MSRGLLALLVCVCACSGEGSGSPDSGGPPAGDGGSRADAESEYNPDCWPDQGIEEFGSIEVGTPDPFTAMGDDHELTLVIGPQGGVHIDLQARMAGLTPGTPDDPLSEQNPFTRFSAIDEDGVQLSAIPCGFRDAYLPDGDGYLLDRHVILFLKNQYVSPSTAEDRIGTQIEIGVDIIDAAGNHAADRHWTTVTEVIESDTGGI